MDEKERLIVMAFGGEVPEFLFYHLGDIDGLSDYGLPTAAMFVDDKTKGPVVFQLFNSDDSTRSNLVPVPEGISRFTVLRVRGASRLLYAFEFYGFECHLIQAGSQEGRGHVINFMNRWGPSPLDPVKDEVDQEQECAEEEPPPPTRPVVQGSLPDEAPVTETVRRSWFRRWWPLDT